MRLVSNDIYKVIKKKIKNKQTTPSLVLIKLRDCLKNRWKVRTENHNIHKNV